MNEVRLIDANALKANLPEPTTIKQNWVYRTLCDFIDNAPTVSAITKEKLSNAYDQGYEDGKNNWLQEERPQGEYEIACNVLLSLEQIVRSSDGWEDSAVEAVHNAVQTAIKCMHERPQGECRTCIHRDPEDKKCDCGELERQGCIFRVSDDYFCKFYEKGGAEE